MYKLVITSLILFVLGVLYDKYTLKQNKTTFHNEQDIIRKYLIGEDTYNTLELNLNNGKPNMWIYIDYEKNARSWISFGSRTSYNLNKPYILLCIESIIRHNADDFNICIIDKNSFPLLLPNWNIDLNSVAEPIQTYMTHLALMKVLYTYGGYSVPKSFICFKSLYPMYEKTLHSTMDSFVWYSQDYNNTATYNVFNPCIDCIGCYSKSNTILNIIQKMELLNSMDYTSEQKFKGTMNQYINYLVETKQMNYIKPESIGCAKYDIYNKIIAVNIEDYFSIHPIHLDKDIYGIYIRESLLSIMNKYNWFDYISIQEIIQGNYNIASYIKYSLYN